MGKVLSDKAKSKKYKVVETYKREKNLVQNTQHSSLKFKVMSDFKEMSLDSIHKNLNKFHKIFDGFKNLTSKTKND